MASFLIRAVREKRSAARALSARAALSVIGAFNRLVSPVSTDEDRRRRERVLNMILAISLPCFIALGATVAWNRVAMGDLYDGIHPLVLGAAALFYVALFAMSKKGHGRSASFMLVISEATWTIYTGWQWGASLPATLLLTALVIVTASVLLGSTTGFAVTGGMLCVLTALGVHEAAVLNVPDWRYDEITVADVISYSALFLFMSFIGWLSNREIDVSLARARTSEKLLETERNALEKRVAERTAELVAAQTDAMAGLERSAEIGELSQGVFHDLIGPLSAIALSVEETADMSKNGRGLDTRRTRDMVEKAVAAATRMRSYMESVRRHIGKTDGPAARVKEEMAEGIADIFEEISITRDILAYKARMANVSIIIRQLGAVAPEKQGKITVYARPVRVHQMLLNLMSNAIDACSEKACGNKDKDGEKIVKISAEKVRDMDGGESIKIVVADNGCGIPAERLGSLFDRPFTTKSHGTGIGLMTVKSIVEKELGGSIEVKSAEGIGTTFVVTAPKQPFSSSARP